ncbi:MFS transporter [Bartonella sp. HY038]|uniref:MFS transporter n=1 Tax=Bartonella sp. HY038 TaxID=2759660 RepID=UPI0015FA0E40|nr:MFS transporter [Bartonella sp. HY038]
MDNIKNDGDQWQPTPISQKDINYASIITFFAWVFAVYDFILFGMLLPVMGQDFGWDEAKQTEMATLIAIGGTVVAFVIGPIVDRIGRRKGIIFTVVGTGIASALTSLGISFGKMGLILVRSVAGLGYAEQGINAAYLTEIYAKSKDLTFQKRKGFIYSLVQSGWPVGALTAAGLTAILLPYIGWQGCFIFAAIPCFIVAFFARKLKESPQFEIMKKISELKKAGKNDEIKALAERFNIAAPSHQQTSIKVAFQGKALRSTLVLSFAVLLNWAAIQVFSVLGTSVIVNIHKLSFENSLLILVLSNLVGFAGYLVHGMLGDRIGRRNTIAIGWILGGFAFSAMIFLSSNLTVVITLYSVGLFFLTGPYAALMFFMGESFPTQIRATGGAIILAMGPLGAILAGIGITFVLKSGGEWASAAFWFGALPCFLSGLMIFATPHIKPENMQ